MRTSSEDMWNDKALKLARAVFWVWINLLPMTIDNQRQPDSIQEDATNKPWRTMPSGRLSSEQAKYIMLALYPIAIISSLYVGGWRQSLSLLLLGVWYNDFGGSDASPITRNLLNALGFICFTSGAMEVTLGQPLPPTSKMIEWFSIIASVIFTTIHTQDMYDQVGDSERNRKTIPLVIGDGPARWTIALPMGFWCWFCPLYWHLPYAVWMVSISLGLSVALRTISMRSLEDDKVTFKFWMLWLVVLYSLPLLKQYSK